MNDKKISRWQDYDAELTKTVIGLQPKEILTFAFDGTNYIVKAHKRLEDGTLKSSEHLINGIVLNSLLDFPAQLYVVVKNRLSEIRSK